MTLIATLGGRWEEGAGATWRRINRGELRELARLLREAGARLVAILCVGATRLSWHFARGGELVALETVLSPGEAAPSIVDLFPGADWAERETRDYYAVAFEGRADTPPLVLRAGDAPGVLR